MIAGQTINRLICLQYATGALAGSAVVCSSAAAFTGLGFAITWYDSTGTALTAQPAYTITPVDTARGVHVLSYALPGGNGYALASVPAAYRQDPIGWSIDGQSYDDASVASLLLTQQGVPAVISAADGALGDVVSADAYNSGTLYIPSGKLARFGLTFASLNLYTISAGAKSQPSDTMVQLTCAFGATYLTDGAFVISWDTMDPAMQLDSATYSKVWSIDVQLRQTAAPNRLITPNRYTINVVWQRDTVV